MIVSAVSGDAAASGSALLEAIDGISDAAEGKPYRVLVGPGHFNLGSTTLTMQAYVDLAGSGAGRIDLTSNGLNPQGGTILTSAASPPIVGAEHTQISDLSIVGTTGGPVVSYTTILPAFGSLGPPAALRRVVILANGASPIGIAVDNSTIRVEDVEIRVSGSSGSNIGISIDNPSMPELRRIAIDISSSSFTSTGIYVDASNTAGLSVEDAQINVQAGEATGYGIFHDGTGQLMLTRVNAAGNSDGLILGVSATTRVAYSYLSGVTNADGTLSCAYMVDSSNQALSTITSCP